MHVTWILSAANAQEVQGKLTSQLASYRYRVSIPMNELRSKGHTCETLALSPGKADGQAAGRALERTEVAVFSKNHTEQAEVIAMLDHARSRRIPTIADVCDDYFEPGAKFESHYRAVVEKADLVTASSEKLALFVKEATGRRPRVIADPYEGPGGPPRWKVRDRHVKGLWFGNPGNMQSLIREAERLPARMNRYRMDLLVLTREFPGIDDAFRRFNHQHRTKLTLRFKPWSLESNWTELSRCDLSIIPVDDRERFYLAKGPNRLIETLWAGRFAAVNSIPSYDEFKAWAWVGEIAEGIAWALEHPAEVVQRIASAQEYIRQRYSPAVIATDWENALSEAIELCRSRQQ